MRLRLRAGGTFIAVASAVALVAGCGNASSTGSGKVATVNNLTRAADVSSAAPGFKVVMSMRETVPSAGQVGMTARGSFSPALHAGAMTMNMVLPPSSGPRTLQLQMVLDKTTVYVKLPAQYATKVPGGKPWLYVDLAQMGKAEGIPGLGSLLSSTSSLNDPGQYLSFLRATAVGSIKNLGPATVNGVRTTHYSAEVNLAKLPSTVPASQRQSVEQLVATLKQKGVSTQMPINAWIDASHLIRRVQIAYTAPLDGQSLTADISEDFLQYGPQPAPAVPSPSQSTNLLSLANGG
ncbi:MAG TPA: hypothetical protein VMF57_21650 [Solirubrobacteraceae bacterium]|nr:hypothetical protein [Solirubrobacteraceae bacterium]